MWTRPAHLVAVAGRAGQEWQALLVDRVPWLPERACCRCCRPEGRARPRRRLHCRHPPVLLLPFSLDPLSCSLAMLVRVDQTQPSLRLHCPSPSASWQDHTSPRPALHDSSQILAGAVRSRLGPEQRCSRRKTRTYHRLTNPFQRPRTSSSPRSSIESPF